MEGILEKLALDDHADFGQDLMQKTANHDVASLVFKGYVFLVLIRQQQEELQT